MKEWKEIIKERKKVKKGNTKEEERKQREKERNEGERKEWRGMRGRNTLLHIFFRVNWNKRFLSLCSGRETILFCRLYIIGFPYGSFSSSASLLHKSIASYLFSVWLFLLFFIVSFYHSSIALFRLFLCHFFKLLFHLFNYIYHWCPVWLFLVFFIFNFFDFVNSQSSVSRITVSFLFLFCIFFFILPTPSHLFPVLPFVFILFPVMPFFYLRSGQVTK